jgi:hypothetical protein
METKLEPLHSLGLSRAIAVRIRTTIRKGTIRARQQGASVSEPDQYGRFIDFIGLRLVGLFGS